MVKKYTDYRMRLRNIRVYIYDPTKEQIENLKAFDSEFLCYRQEKNGYHDRIGWGDSFTKQPKDLRQKPKRTNRFTAFLKSGSREPKGMFV